MNPVVGVNGDATTLTQRMTTENEEPGHIDGVVELILTIVTIHIYIITVPLYTNFIIAQYIITYSQKYSLLASPSYHRSLVLSSSLGGDP